MSNFNWGPDVSKFKRNQTCGSYDLSFGAGRDCYYRPTSRRWRVVKRYAGRVTLQSGKAVFEGAVRTSIGGGEYVDVRGLGVGSHRVVPYVPKNR